MVSLNDVFNKTGAVTHHSSIENRLQKKAKSINLI